MDMARDMITAAIGDADSSVRATARRAYWVLRLRFRDLAESVMGSLPPSTQVSTAAAARGVLTLFVWCSLIFVYGGVLVVLLDVPVLVAYQVL